jgi:hypothetical protein
MKVVVWCRVRKSGLRYDAREKIKRWVWTGRGVTSYTGEEEHEKRMDLPSSMFSSKLDKPRNSRFWSLAPVNAYGCLGVMGHSNAKRGNLPTGKLGRGLTGSPPSCNPVAAPLKKALPTQRQHGSLPQAEKAILDATARTFPQVLDSWRTALVGVRAETANSNWLTQPK